MIKPSTMGMLMWILLAVAGPGGAIINWPSVEKNLTISILNNYQKYGIVGRPVNDSKDLMRVQYGLQLIQILDLDENKQILRTNCWSMYRWHDKLLEWNPAEHAGITEIRVFPDQIWTPDIKLYNFADVRLKEARVARVVVKHTGRTLWVPQSIFKSTCPVEITYFPFDTQICMLEFGSWVYDIGQLDIMWWVPDDSNVSSPYIDFSDYLPSNEWRTDGEVDRDMKWTGVDKIQIGSAKKVRTRIYISANGVSETKSYPVLRYVVRLRRNPSFYVSILVIPCILLSSLTLVVFWLPPESPAKMMLGMNIFVAFFVLLLLLAESTPSAVKKFPLIGAYFCLNMIMITLSTFLATLVINFYFRGDYAGPLPHMIRRIAIEGLGRLLLVRQHIPLPEESVLVDRVLTRAENGCIRKCRLKIPNLDSNKFLTSPVQSSEPQITRELSPRNTNPFINSEETSEGKVWQANVRPLRSYSSVYRNTPLACLAARPNPITDTEDSPLLMRCQTTLENDIRELKRYIRMFVNRQKENNRKNLISMEWRTLALVLDRLFFVLYISSILIAVITCIPSSIEPVIPEAFRN